MTRWHVIGALVPALVAALANPFGERAAFWFPLFVFLLFLGVAITLKQRRYPTHKRGFQRDSANRR